MNCRQLPGQSISPFPNLRDAPACAKASAGRPTCAKASVGRPTCAKASAGRLSAFAEGESACGGNRETPCEFQPLPAAEIGSLSPERGSLLLIALWSLSLLTIFSIYLAYGVRYKVSLLERLDRRDNLHFIAEAGTKKAIFELMKDEPSQYDSLNEPWGNNENIFKQVKTGYGYFNLIHDYLDSDSGSRKVRYGIVDEERKVNLNKAELEVIRRIIMITTGLEQADAESLAASIIDWRDSDSKLTIPLGSAEDRYYRSLPNPYEAKDAEIEVFDELLLIRGMTEEILEKIKNYITIYSNGRININTAGGEVLMALDLNDELVEKIISFRLGEDTLEATFDDNIFISLSDIISKLGTFSELTPEEVASLSNLISSGKITTSSSNFMARSIAQLDDRQMEAICIFDREGKVLSWREG